MKMMISYLSGIILQKTDKFVVVDVNGVGYRVFVSKETLTTIAQEGDAVKLFCAFEVREDAHELYGFLHKEELEFYEMLRTVSGVGPKSALAILSLAAVNVLASAIAAENTAFLAKVSGIGRKTAEKITLELRDKVAKLGAGAIASEEDVDVLEALESLGYSTREAAKILQSLPKDLTGTEARLREALKFLGGK